MRPGHHLGLAACLVLALAASALLYSARAQSVYTSLIAPTPGIVSVQPAALSSGQISTTLTMTDGSQVSGTSTSAVNTAQISSSEYDTVTNGVNIQVAQGITIEVLSGSGVIAAATVNAPPSPANNQLFRIGMVSGPTITALTVKSSGGAATVDTAASVLLGFSRVYIYQLSTTSWVRIQ